LLSQLSIVDSNRQLATHNKLQAPINNNTPASNINLSKLATCNAD